MWYIVRLDSSRVATLVKVRSATRVSSSDPTGVKSNYIPVYTTILRQIERCPWERCLLHCIYMGNSILIELLNCPYHDRKVKGDDMSFNRRRGSIVQHSLRYCPHSTRCSERAHTKRARWLSIRLAIEMLLYSAA